MSHADPGERNEYRTMRTLMEHKKADLARLVWRIERRCDELAEDVEALRRHDCRRWRDEGLGCGICHDRVCGWMPLAKEES
jgi:hypothetical protein